MSRYRIPGLQPARFTEVAKGEYDLWLRIKEPWSGFVTRAWQVLDIPDVASRPWELTPQAEAEFDKAVGWFIDSMVGKVRDAEAYSQPSNAAIDVTSPIYEGEPILPGQLRTAYEVGITRAEQVIGEGAERLLGIRNEQAVEAALQRSFHRLSDGARVKIGDVLNGKVPGGSVLDLLRDGMREGHNPLRISRDLQRKFADIDGYNWARLARTEVSFFQNAAMFDTYHENGYRVPTLPQDLGGTAVEMPPYHPHCVCGTTIDPATKWVLPDVAVTACEVCQNHLALSRIATGGAEGAPLPTG